MSKVESIKSLKEGIIDSVNITVKQQYGIDLKDVVISNPPKIEMGDYAVNCFPLARELRKNPNEISKKLAENFYKNDFVDKVSSENAFLNLNILSKQLFGIACKEIIERADEFGNSDIGKGKKVMVEYISPNTNKPLHLGHVRNGDLGMALSNLLEVTGHKVTKAILINDRGIHICKSMLAWKKWGEGSTPESTNMKGDHFVGALYVRYNQEEQKNPDLINEAQEMLQKWEKGDPEIIELWEKMNEWVYKGFDETFNEYGYKFDKTYYESDTYKLGKDTIKKGIDKGVFKKDKNGNIIVEFPISEFGADKDGQSKRTTVLRADGTSVYMTQDIGTAELKFNEFGLDKSIYLVGSEQDYHFKSLFKILDMLGFEWAKDCYHFSYGMVKLPEGKMKSREGTVVDADDILRDLTQLAKTEIENRNKDGVFDPTILDRAKKIGKAGIKYFMLKATPAQDILFDSKTSISFEGNTGPYIQYSYARSNEIINKAKEKNVLTNDEIDYSLLGTDQERILIKHLINFPDAIADAAAQLSPAKIASYTFQLSQEVNRYYQKDKIINPDDKKLSNARISLLKSSMVCIKKGLNLLGIDVVDKM